MSTSAPSDATVQSIDPRMGTFCWWDLDESRVTPDHLRQVLAAEGMTDISVPDIDPVSAIRKAAQNWATGRGNDDRHKAEVTAIDGGKVYVGILQHRRESAREVGWRQVETLVYDISSQEWENRFPSSYGAAFIAAADNFLRYLDHRWLRPNVLVPQLEAAQAISLRRQGGIYFAPLANLDAIKRLKRVVSQLGGCRFFMVMVENDPDSREGVGSGVKDHVLGQLLDVESQLEEWRASTRKIRTDSQANVLGNLAGLLGLADLYERTLEVSLQDLRAKVQQCQDEAMAILAGQGA